MAEAVDVGDFFDRHRAALVRYAYLLTGNRGAAEDLVQEAVARLLKAHGDLTGVPAPVAYVRSSIANLYLERGRRDSAWLRRVSQLFVRDDQPDPADTLAIRDQVRRGLSLLSDRQRAAIVLHYYLDLSYDEVGATLRCPAATARSLTLRGLQRMRVTLTRTDVGVSA